MENIHYSSTHERDINLITADYHKFAFQKHYHLDYHIGLITAGEQRFHYAGKQHHVGQGELVIMPPDALHDGQSLLDTGYQVRVFSVEPQWFKRNFDHTQHYDIMSFSQLVLQDRDIFSRLAQLHVAMQRDNIAQLAKDCIAVEGFEPLLDRYAQAEHRLQHSLGSQSLAVVKAFLIEHLDQPVRLATLAKLCHLSPSQFQRQFKAKTHMSAHAYLTRLRLEKAMQLLKRQYAVANVAHEVGFYDQAHFSKAFKATFGVVPSAVN